MNDTFFAGTGDEIAPGMAAVYRWPLTLRDVPTHYCPGCSHGVVQRLIAEVIDELGMRERAICVAPVGCAVFLYQYLDIDGCEAAHGRAPAMATGLKRMLPDRLIFTYQGDGDLAAIGGNEILHAAVRGECISVLFLNNAVFGMTGGQMAPTTLPGQVTSTTPQGRQSAVHGSPLHITELLAQVPGVAYAVRRSLHSPAEIGRTRQAIRQAFIVQQRGLGLSLVEMLGACPTNWGLTPTAALAWIKQQMIPVFPLGDFKNVLQEG